MAESPKQLNLKFFMATDNSTSTKHVSCLQPETNFQNQGQLKKEAKSLATQKIKNLVRKFNSSIEMNKDYQAYSDFKEGVNKGMDIARYTFEENAEKFSLPYSDEDWAVRIGNLQDEFNQLLDGIILPKKPNCSEERLDGVYSGFERSKKIFGEFIKESYPLENS
jgi:hypothetical protein